ncbi:MAG: tetratricopeptide repeat protein [Magnetovibrionaceae bacterium]
MTIRAFKMIENLDALFEDALRHHRADRLGEAARLYDRILAVEPEHAEALHLKGLATFQSGREEQGLELVERAVTLQPMNPGYQANLGRIAKETGRLEQSIAAFSASLAFQPDQPGLWGDLSGALLDLDRFEQAVSAARRGLALTEELFAGWYNMGQALANMGEFEEAADALAQALRVDDRSPATYGAYGLVLARLGRVKEAADAFGQAVERAPDQPAYVYNHAHALQDSGDLVGAEKAYLRVIQLAPGNGGAWNNLGVVRLFAGRFEDAADAFARALLADGTHGTARVNRAQALQGLGRHEEALAELDVVLAENGEDLHAASVRAGLLVALGGAEEAVAGLKPLCSLADEDPSFWTALGCAEAARPDLDAADRAFDRALAITPDHADARINKAMTALLRGDLQSGWSGFEARYSLERLRHRLPTAGLPRWTGKACSGKRLAILAEQGFGDTLQMIRFLAPALQRAEARGVLHVPNALVPLLKGTPGLEVVGKTEPLPAADLEIPLMSLPGLFDAGESDLMGEEPYLSAPLAARTRWAERFSNDEALKVGFAWSGNPRQANDRNRSLADARMLAPLVGMEGILAYGLQVGAVAGDLTALEDLGLRDLSSELTDFAETAAVLEQLDLVITVDSAVAHLAGALGKPIWVMLCRVPDWRWQLDRADCPWYGSARLFRQSNAQDWKPVVEEVRQALQAQVTLRR